MGDSLMKLALAAAAAVAGLVLIVIASSNATAGLLADDAIYLLMADWFSTALGLSDSNTGFVWRHSQFPPLYPLVIGMLGGNAGHIAYAHGLTASMTVVGAILAYFWMRSKATLSATTCVAIVAWWLLMPKTVFASIEAMSEPLYICLTYAALTLYERADGRCRYFYAAAALVALCTLTRATGIALAAAFVLCTWYHLQRREWLVVATVVVIPIGLWNLASARFFGAVRVYVREPSQYFSYSSVEGILNALFVGWPKTFWAAWIGQFQTIDILAVRIICAALLFSATIGWIRRLRRAELDACYVALYLLLIWIWPYPDHIHRFIWPLMPMLIFYAAEVVALGANLGGTGGVALRNALILVVMAIALPNWAVLVQRFSKDLPVDMSQYAGSRFNLRADRSDEAVANILLFRGVTSAIARAGAMVPADDCVTASNRDLMMLYGRRPSVFPPLPAVDDATFDAAIECRYLFIQHAMSNPYLPDNYPAARVKLKESLADFAIPATPAPVAIGTLYRIVRP